MKSNHRKLTDLPTEALEKLAASGGSLDFLRNKREDIYSDKDGEKIRRIASRAMSARERPSKKRLKNNSK